MQFEMPLMQDVSARALVSLPDDLVSRCNHQHEAVSLCMRNARIKRTIENWADMLGTSKGTLSLLLNGGSRDRKRYFPPEMIEQIQREAGNRAVSQWWRLLGEGMLYRQRGADVLSEAI